MGDPFRLDGPTLLNISGGRTSALMLRRVLDAHDGALPDDAHAVFCNTGGEHAGTLDFLDETARQWARALLRALDVGGGSMTAPTTLPQLRAAVAWGDRVLAADARVSPRLRRETAAL